MADEREYDEQGKVKSGYLTPEEAREMNVPWMARPGESQNLRDPNSHYQTPDESRSININWATQPKIRAGTSPHPEMTALYNLMNQRGALDELEGFGYEGYKPKRGSQLPDMTDIMRQMGFSQPSMPAGQASPYGGGWDPNAWITQLMAGQSSQLPPELRALLQFLPR